MGCNFFDKQRVDVAGVLAVRLEKLLLVFFSLSLVGLSINVYEMLHWHVFFMFPFTITATCWAVWYLGWFGATRRNTCALLAYFILTLIGSILQVMGFLFTSVGGSLITVLTLNSCAGDPSCPKFEESKRLLNDYPWIITIIFALSIAVFIIPVFLNVIGLFLSMAVRKELMALKKAQHLVNQEEGCCNSTKMDSFVQEQEQQQQQQIPEPVFYTPQQASPFVPQGYMPLAVGNGASASVIYVPYAQEYNPQ